MRKTAIIICAMLLMLALVPAGSAQQANRQIGINVLLKGPVTSSALAELGKFGRVRDVAPEIQAVTMQVAAGQLSAIRALPSVAAANPDAERKGVPIQGVQVADFSAGLSTWNLDAIDVTDLGHGRVIAQDGTGVYVAVLDTGLLDSWRQYFPQERIATQFGICFGGGGGDVGFVSTQPGKWQHDQDSHGTHVTSTILGYNLGGSAINGVAPKAKVIPVKVLNQNGSGWSSVIARGIVYVANLKTSGALGSSPVVINMSLGGPSLDAMEQEAIDYAIARGVVIVASAGNEGDAGMGYPGAYAPVISVAAAGWKGEWKIGGTWWYGADVAEPTIASDFYITDFSSREKTGQELDVAAPGSWIVGPYQTNSGNTPSYYFLGGTSMASPHVAGIAALMLQKNPTLKQAGVEVALRAGTIPLSAGSMTVNDGSGGQVQYSWGDDATGAGLVNAARALAMVP